MSACTGVRAGESTMLPLAAWLNAKPWTFRSLGLGRRATAEVPQTVIQIPPPAPRITTAFERMSARFPGLRPEHGDVPSFESWLAGLGETVSDEDAAELYITICELCGWHLPAQQPTAGAAEVPVSPPPPIITETRAVPALPVRTTLHGAQAAERFVEWVRLADRCGTYSNRELSELCAEFFEAEDILPISDNVFRPHLEKLRSDVTKSRADNTFRHKGKKGRNRNYLWTVHELETVSVPWEDLPERKAA